MYKFNVENVTKDLINWIKKWFEENGKGGTAVIGISGGKDSTIIAKLCVNALGKDKVIGVMMPNGVQKDISDSIRVCELLDIKNYTINIEDSVNGILNQMKQLGIEITEQTKTNLPARIRMSTLYAVSQSCHIGRVVNTCNLSEDTVGFFSRWGDGVGDFAPFAELTTVEILQIGDYLGLPYDLVHKTPIDGLNTKEDGTYLTDEDSLGVNYDEIHSYIRGDGKLNENVYNKIKDKHEKNMFKLLPIPKFTPRHSDLYVINNRVEIDNSGINNI